MPAMLPPVLLELRSSAKEFIAENRAAVESLGGLDAAGVAAARAAEESSAKESAARARLAAATAVDSNRIKASVDEQIAAEKRLATEMGQAYNETARRAQLSTAAIQRASKEQIDAQREVVAAERENKAAQAEFAAASERAATQSQSAWAKYTPRVKQVLGAAGAAVAIESLKMAASFQRQTSRLVTAAGESESAIGMVREGIKNIATSTGTELSELNSGAYMIESAGFHGANALKVLKAAAQGAAVEGADMKSVGNALTTVMNDMGAKASDAGKYMSEMVAAVGQGKMTMDDLAGSIHSVLPNAAKLGMTFPQVAGALAEMTAQGMSADQSAQNLNHTIVKLAAPTIGMTKTMAMYGLTSSDVAKKLGKTGLAGTMEELERAIMQHMGPAGTTLISAFNQSKTAGQDLQIMLGNLHGSLHDEAVAFMTGHESMKSFTAATKAAGGQQAVLGTQFLGLYKAQHGFNDLLKSGSPAAQTFTAAMKGMLGDQTGLQVALHLTGENMTGFKDKIRAIGQSSTDAKGNVRDWSITQNLLSVQLARAKQMVEVLAVDIGSKLIPIVSSVVGWFLKHKTVTMALAGVIGGLMVASIGAYVAKLTMASMETVGKLGVMVAGWMGLGPAVATAATEATVATEGMAAASETAGAATTTAFGPIGLAITAVGVAAMLLASHWKQIWHGIEAVAKWVWNDALKPVFHALEDAWSAIWAGIQNVWDSVGKPIFKVIAWEWTTLWDGVKAVWDDVIQPVIGFLRDAFDGLKPFITGVLGAIGDAWDATWGAVKTVWNSVIRPVFNLIKTVALWPLRMEFLAFKKTVELVWTGISAALRFAYNGVIRPVGRAISLTFQGIGAGLKWAWDNVVHPVIEGIKKAIQVARVVIGKVVGVISGLWKGIGDGLQWVYDHTIKPVIDFILGMIQSVKDALKDLSGGAIDFGTGGHVHAGGTIGAFDPNAPGVKPVGHAGGGMVGNGWFTVGEQGPELGYKSGNQVRIFSNPESQRMAPGGSGDVTVVMYNVLDGKVVSKQVERAQLRTGARRGTTYQAYVRGGR